MIFISTDRLIAFLAKSNYICLDFSFNCSREEDGIFACTIQDGRGTILPAGVMIVQSENSEHYKFFSNSISKLYREVTGHPLVVRYAIADNLLVRRESKVVLYSLVEEKTDT